MIKYINIEPYQFNEQYQLLLTLKQFFLIFIVFDVIAIRRKRTQWEKIEGQKKNKEKQF